MKRMLYCLFLSASVFITLSAQQISVYKSETGDVLRVCVGTSATTFMLNNAAPFNLVVSGIGDGWYCYNANDGRVLISQDIKNAIFEVYNPYKKLFFSLTGFENIQNPVQYPTNTYQNQYSGRSRYQIQYDINKAYDNLNSMIRNREKAGPIIQMQYNRMIVDEKARIRQLELELSNAPY